MQPTRWRWWRGKSHQEKFQDYQILSHSFTLSLHRGHEATHQRGSFFISSIGQRELTRHFISYQMIIKWSCQSLSLLSNRKEGDFLTFPNFLVTQFFSLLLLYYWWLMVVVLRSPSLSVTRYMGFSGLVVIIVTLVTISYKFQRLYYRGVLVSSQLRVHWATIHKTRNNYRKCS